MNRALKLKMQDLRREVHLELVPNTGVDRLPPNADATAAVKSAGEADPIANAPTVALAVVPHDPRTTGPTDARTTGPTDLRAMTRQQIRSGSRVERGSELKRDWGRDYTPRLQLVPPPKPEAMRSVEAQSSLNPANIWFNWNGHSWCAFEVLGIAPSSSVAAAQEAFRLAINRSDIESHPFLNEAIQAIERSCK